MMDLKLNNNNVIYFVDKINLHVYDRAGYLSVVSPPKLTKPRGGIPLRDIYTCASSYNHKSRSNSVFS